MRPKTLLSIIALPLVLSPTAAQDKEKFRIGRAARSA